MDKGQTMTRIMASGVFDILHTGHLAYLEQAKSLGDELIVVVACDAVATKRKHIPVTPETMRMRLVGALKPVDRAIIGNEGDMFATVREVEPDIIVLGFDQTFDDDFLRKQLEEKGLGHISVVRANQCAEDLTATRAIIKKIVESHNKSY